MDQKKVCDKCGGRGATIGLAEDISGQMYLRNPEPCPCLTERMARLEKVAEAAKDWLQDTAGDCDHHPEWQSLSKALTALEGEEND